jgi:hypothetical protein
MEKSYLAPWTFFLSTYLKELTLFIFLLNLFLKKFSFF